MIEPQATTQWLEQAREQIEEVRVQATRWDDSLRRFTREQPVAAILIAATGGYLLARIATRLS
jgi:hypothetical protein